MMEEHPYFCSAAVPDTTVAAWTETPQSFLDLTASPTRDGTTVVSRAELLRCRYNLRLGDTPSLLFSWRPFGDVAKSIALG
ncbi:hypothetical protein F5Y12DRAFT_772636, partial [Xylaria sp. FL1777]